MSIEDKLDAFEKSVRKGGILNFATKIVYPSHYEKTLAHWADIKRNGDFDAVDRAHDKIIAYYDNEILHNKIDSNDLLSRLNKILSDRDVQLSFRKYPHYMKDKILHSERLGLILNNAIGMVPEKHSLNLIKLIYSDQVINQAAEIDENKLTNVKGLAADNFSSLIDKAKSQTSEDDFLYSLDSCAYFKACMNSGGVFALINTYRTIVKHMNTEDALRFMRFSDTWRSIDKQPYHRDQIKDLDERLIPALDY